MNRIRQCSLAAAIALAASCSAPAQTTYWTGAGGGLNWSLTGNWNPVGVPNSSSVVYFEDVFNTGYTNGAGLVNNIVDESSAVGSAWYLATATANSTATNLHYFTTFINPGMTLTLGGLGFNSPALAVGDAPGSGNPPFSTSGPTNYTTIKGPGVLAVTDTAGLMSVGMRNRTTLDMSGLSSFNANLKQLWVGVDGDPNNANTFGPIGVVRLGQTNVITTAASLTAPGILLGSAMTNSGASGTGILYLGQTNSFNTDGLAVGGLKAAFGTLINFGPGFSNTVPFSTFVLRGSAGGNTPISSFSIGDISAVWDGYHTNHIHPGNTTAGAGTSTADFSGGVVDILADSIYIGRSAPNEVPVESGTGTGSLIVEQGSVTANNVYVSYKQTATNASAANGTLILRSNAVMNVVNNLSLCYRTNGSTFINQPLLIVSNNAILNVGGNITATNTTGSWTPAAIILGNNGAINMTNQGTVFTPMLLGVGYLTNAGSIIVTNALSINNDFLPGTLHLGNNLTVGTGVPMTFNLGANTTTGGGVNDYLDVLNNLTLNNNPLRLTFGAPLVVGTYTLATYGGTQTGSATWVNPTRSPIGLVQGAGSVAIVVTNLTPASLTWSGTNSFTPGTANWDSASTNWNNTTQKFFALDDVLFDDTGIATNVPIVGITNLPNSVTFNNTKKYTVTQSSSGAIGGYGSLTKNGTGLLAMGGGGANNYFTGPINLNQGTIQIASFNTGVFGVNDSTNAINIASGAMLDLNGNSVGSSSPAYGRNVNVAGSGVGGIGAIVHNGASGSPALTVRAVALTSDTTFGTTTAGFAWTMAGVNPPYAYPLDLGGNTLTTTGNGAFRLNQLTITNSGSINVGGAYLGLNSLILDGPGTINLGSKYLNFYNGFTTGYVAKAISVSSGGAISAPSPNATPIPLMSPIGITGGGLLYITNSQIILASGVISGVNGSLTKWGNSNLVLSAANTYSGPTTISGGRIVINPGGSLASSLVQVDPVAALDVSPLAGGYTIPAGQNLTVNGTVLGNVIVGGGATLSGFGTNSGTVTVSPNGTVLPGSTLDQGTLQATNGLTFNGGTTVIKLNSTTTVGGGVNDLVAVTGDLTFNATTKVRISPVAGLSGQPYTLFTYSGTLTGAGNIVLSSDSPRYSFTLDTSVAGTVRAIATGSGGDLFWTGADPVNPTLWNVGTTTNWLNGGTPDQFFQGDSVTFDNSGLTNLVTLVSVIKPAGMTNNATGSYILNGTGSLLAGTLAANSGTTVFANTNTANLFNGDGILFNGGAVTFNQPVDSTLQAKLNGSGGSLNKVGGNTLTISSVDATTMVAPVNVNAGTLRAGSSNVLGAGAVTIGSGGTLDINGQALNTATVHAAGVGADGQGAINNRGLAQTNAISTLVLDGNATLGAASNRWDVTFGPNSIQGNGYNLTKLGTNDLWMQSQASSGLSNIDVLGGRLILGGNGNDLGDATTSVLTVHTNAIFGFANGIQAGAKSAVLQAGGSFYANGGSNRFDGQMTITNGVILMDPNATLNLGGAIKGPGTLNVKGVVAGNFGTVVLEGHNTYSGGTVVNDGELIVSNSFSLPANTNVTLSSRVQYNQSGHPILSLGTNVTTPSSVLLDMQTVGSGGLAAHATLDGNGATWAGPIRMSGNLGQCQAIFSSGLGGLIIGGAVDGTTFFGNGTSGGGVVLSGDGVLISDASLGGIGVHFNNSLQFVGTMNCFNTGLGGDPGMTKLVLGAAGNSWTNMFWQRGVIQIGADNALPLTPVQIGTLISGADHRVVLDLNGHNQTLVNWVETFTGNDPTWFGNSSTNANATLTYAGTGTNSWTTWIVDAFDTNAPVQKQTSLSVTAGYLKLLPYPLGEPLPGSLGYFPSGPPAYPMGNAYTGPTTITGGTLEVDRTNDLGLGLSPVTVSGTGTLSGIGRIGGTVTIAAGGTIAPGSNAVTSILIRPLTILSNLTIQPGGKGFFKVNLTTGTNDMVVGINNLVCNGTLTLTNLGAAAYTNGTVIKLFDAASYSVSGVTIKPGSPGNGLMWDTTHLGTDGTLRVVPVVVPVVSAPMTLPDHNIGFSITGGVGQGYTVRASTNVALPFTNWTILENGSLPSVPYSFTDTHATNFPARYYRVSTP
jgi:autotransporter-associated beta strand protein